MSTSAEQVSARHGHWDGRCAHSQPPRSANSQSSGPYAPDFLRAPARTVARSGRAWRSNDGKRGPINYNFYRGEE